jgi:hypothetical protein
MICVIALLISENQAFSQVEMPKKLSSPTINSSPVRIIAAYQSSGKVSSTQWTKRGNRSWVGGTIQI